MIRVARLFNFRSHGTQLAIGALVASSYILLTHVNLTAQGLYYDEVHQATAAFDYVGSRPAMFNYAFHSIPVLNMSYSGAIKSNIYGLYLRFVSRQFTVYSWRLLGISFVASGLFAFYWLAGFRLGLASSIIFGLLLLTDTSLLLLSRHDWGPTALAFSLRLIFIGVWLSNGLDSPVSESKQFFLGLLVGIAAFEKLTAVVLLGPLILMLLAGPRRNRKAWMFAGIGVFIGALPLTLANIGSYFTGRGLVSLADISRGKTELHFPVVARFFYDYASLGSGSVAQSRILGESPAGWWPAAETAFIVAVLLLILVSYRSGGVLDSKLKAAVVMTGCYAAVAIALLLLPRDTDVHHWFLGTPFQYAAIALAAPVSTERKAWRWALTTTVAAIIVCRAPNLVATETSLRAGRASPSFDRAFTRLGELAAGKAHEAAFISADWGTAAQVYCLANGSDNLIYEPFWSPDPARKTFDIVQNSSKNEFYVLITGIKSRLAPSADAVVGEFAHSQAMEPAPVEEEFRGLTHIRVLKFVRKMPAAMSAGTSKPSPRTETAPQL